MLRFWDPNARNGALLVAAALLACTAVSRARAEDEPRAERRVHQLGRRDPLLPIRLAGHVTATWEGAFGLGARADIPLISGTFRYSGRDELAVSVGADVTFFATDEDRGVDLYPTAMLQWSLGVNDRLSFYPELGFIAYVEDRSWEGLVPSIGFGVRYYLHRSFGLNARMGWPVALNVGTVF